MNGSVGWKWTKREERWALEKLSQESGGYLCHYKTPRVADHLMILNQLAFFAGSHLDGAFLYVDLRAVHPKSPGRIRADPGGSGRIRALQVPGREVQRHSGGTVVDSLQSDERRSVCIRGLVEWQCSTWIDEEG